MANYRKSKSVITYPTEQVFVAAAAANRINDNTYVNGANFVSGSKHTNKSLMTQVLDGELVPTQADVELGSKIREHLQTYLFKIVSGQVLNDFESKALALANGEVVSERDIGMIAYYPSSYLAAQESKKIEERLYNCGQQHIGKIGDRVQLKVEVVKSFYSSTYGINFVTGITGDNLLVRFTYKSGFQSGDRINITAKVREHCDGHVTKLNYVKVIAK